MVQQRLTDHPGVQSAWSYPLFDAAFKRRSRRFAMGSEIPGGLTKYKSNKPPMPLDELEEMLLVEIATGVTGKVLADLPYRDDQGRSASGNTIIHFTGLTYASPCASHDTRLIYWNDEATYLVKFDKLTASKVQEYETLDDRERLLKAFRDSRIKLFDGRPQYPHTSPPMALFNVWSSDVPGSTMFLPIADTTFQTINGLLLMCGWADGGYYMIDDMNGNVPAGCERWAKEGLLDPKKPVPLSMLGSAPTVEAAFMMQNLQLAVQAMGLGGWVHGHPAAIVLLGGTPLAKGLGFRFITPKRGRMVRGMAGPAPACVGLDGLLEPYCPPYYKNMDAAVDAVVECKFGSRGIYTPGNQQLNPFVAKSEFIEDVPQYSDKLIQCVKDICNYVYDTYGRFPISVDAVATAGSWFQAHHLDLDFYDRFYEPGAYTETQAKHMELWHGPQAKAFSERLVAAARA